MNNFCLRKGNMYLERYNLDGYNKTNYVSFCLDKDDSMYMSYDEAGIDAELINVLLDITLEREMKENE